MIAPPASAAPAAGPPRQADRKDRQPQPKGQRTGLAWRAGSPDALELLDALALSLGLPNANGALILEAAATGPAGQAGLRFGDIVVGLNGRSITYVNELRQRVASMTPGTDAELEVWRVTTDGGDFLQTLRRLARAATLT